MTWLLGDITRTADPWEDGFTHTVGGTGPGKWGKENLGKCVVLGPFEGHTKLDLTAAPGVTSGVYYSMVFQLGKWEFKVQKVDEAIEVSPVHAQYYQLTLKQKEELEAKIKSGLAQAAQAIGDYELLKHDERKYQEFMDYFNAKDEHSLRAVFIDQVDVHNGDTALRNIVQRWPTIIADFMRCGRELKESETADVEQVKTRLGVSRAEAVVLVTKNKLYTEWKKLFFGEVESRLKRIKELVNARQKSIDEYREWLKPYVTRFKLLKQAFEIPGVRKTAISNYVMAGGHAISSSSVKIWSWKDVTIPEIRRAAPELVFEKPLEPYDDFIKRELIWNPNYGLVIDYPWITPKWIDKAVQEIKDDRWLLPGKLYYGFLEVIFDRHNARLASGAELEDGIFHVNVLFMSQNGLLAKLLELKCRQQEMENYVDDLLGIAKPRSAQLQSEQDLKLRLSSEKSKLKGLEADLKAKKDDLRKAKEEDDRLKLEKQIVGLEKNIKDQEDAVKDVETQMDYMYGSGESISDKLKAAIGYRGPYEWNINERLAKYLIKPMAESSYVALVGFLKEKFGVGRT